MGTFAIIALVLSALAAAGSGIASYVNTKKTNEANLSQYEDWKAYNSPANQMERLGEAGLNPYMISGVNNTLSQPFQFGQNSGIAEALQGLSQATSNGVGQYTSAAIKREANDIRRDQIDIQRDKLEFEKSFGELKKEMMNTAIRKGDKQAALFWSSAQQKDVVTNYLKRTMPFRVGKAFYDYLGAQQNYSFNELLNPMKLDFYPRYQRAKINNLWANTSHLGFMENYMLDRFLFAKEMQRRNYNWNKEKFFIGMDNANNNFMKRLHLSEDYYDLAYNKWITNTLMQGLGFFKPFGKSGSYSGWNVSY